MIFDYTANLFGSSAGAGFLFLFEVVAYRSSSPVVTGSGRLLLLHVGT